MATERVIGVVEGAEIARDLSDRSLPQRYPLLVFYGDATQGYPYVIARDPLCWEPNVRYCLFDLDAATTEGLVRLVNAHGHIEGGYAIAQAQRLEYLSADDVDQARQTIDERPDGGHPAVAMARQGHRLFQYGRVAVATGYASDTGTRDADDDEASDD